MKSSTHYFAADASLQHLFENATSLADKGGILLMVRAARSGNFAAVSFLEQHYGANIINRTVQVFNEHLSVLLLSAESREDPFGYPRHIGDSRGLPAGAETLRFLIQRGVDIGTCHPILWTYRHWVGGEQLCWLVDNGFDCCRSSIYSIVLPNINSWRFRDPREGPEE